jgi:pimeloyl-ACP methyl ester carboxylesterase
MDAHTRSERPSVEFVRTADDWDLALHRYRSARSDLPPVILCAGYACNRYFLDFDERYSLARFLARRGFDTWVLELRGRGYSEPAGGSSRNRSWTFDDLVRFDVPAAIAHVRGRCAGRPPVWIGHSMGGMVMYAALGENAALTESVAGFVAMASPVAFPPIASWMAQRLGEFLLLLPFPARLPQHNILVALWSLVGNSARASQVGMNPHNLDHAAFGRALRQFICNVPRRKLQQFVRWSLTGAFRSADGCVDYRANLHRITTPAFIIAGAADQLATPEIVGLAYDRIGSPAKRYREFAAGPGVTADYGHVDLIFGSRAPDEVFPAISTWIETELESEVR